MDRLPLRSEIILTQEQLAAVGAVAIEATYLEQQLELVLWRLSGLDEHRGPQFTANMQFRSRVEALHVLGRMVLPTTADAEFQSLIRELDECGVQRNHVIHGTWIAGAGDFLELWADGAEKHPPANAVKKPKYKPAKTMAATEIETVACRIAAARDRLGRFYDGHWSSAWAKTPQVTREPG
jgi:hypothetical protein